MKKLSKEFEGLIDADKLRAEFSDLTGPLDNNGSSSEIRSQILSRLKICLNDGRKLIEKKLLEDGGGTLCAKRLCYLQDQIIHVIYDFAATHVYRVTNPSTSERMSVVAVGGYGRGTLAPGSDLDLLFVLPYKQTPWGESIVEYILYMLWDMGLKVGHATRSVDECIRLSKSDMTIRTAILESRYLWGDRELFDDLVTRFKSSVVQGSGPEFITAKLTERDERHRNQGASRYLVEPNVKEGKGGLRDLNTLFWISKYFYQVESGDALVKKGVFSRSEHARFKKCEDFLWATRCHMHFLTGRAEERLSFDIQREIALRLSYTSHPGLREVERFMKHYFLIAKDVGDLTRILCAALEVEHIKPAPSLSRFLKALGGQRKIQPIKGHADFIIENQRINIASPDVFKRDPVNLIRIFFLAGNHNLAFHPNAMKRIRRSLGLIDKGIRNDKTANRLFLKILTSRDDPESVLRRMNETGVLGRFVPEFGKVVAMMQFNMYHHYTVDEHLLRSIGVLSEIERGELDEDHPLSTEIIKGIQSRNALYVAVFLHDVAKGRPQDHSIAGARIAKELCPRFGLSPAETGLVSWLIENHLVMSMVAQSRDLNDNKTIQDFAKIVQSPERLKLLLILTVADIKAVGPGVFNGWKGQLLRTLYYETEPVLAGGHSQLSRKQQVSAAQDALIEKLDGWEPENRLAYLDRHYPAYWMRVNPDDQIKHAELIREADQAGKKLATLVRPHEFEAITEITVLAPDHPRLLTTIAGACFIAGANIVDSQIYTTTDGLALDTISVTRAFDKNEDELRRAERITEIIENTLSGRTPMPENVAQKAAKKNNTAVHTFDLETSILVTNAWSDQFTVLEVSGLDRPGLLYDLTSAISNLNLNIASAHIVTFGERAVDVFYVTDLIGHKISSVARQTRIKKTLIEAFDGVEEKTRTAQVSNIRRRKRAG
ncbi:MAG: [protein-PII] uridylyltransferase [Stappiaceae bacterium]